MPESFDLIVGIIAIACSAGAGAAACNLWTLPYGLSSAVRIEQRWGRAVVRGYFGLLAIALGFAAVCIFGGMRPRFANPVRATLPQRLE